MEMNKAYKKMRAINFDLSIKALKEHYSEVNPKGAYKEINHFFRENNFEHRQGSGYCSKRKMTDIEIMGVIDQMYEKLPWIDKCSKHIDVTDIGAVYDIKEMRAAENQKQNRSIKRKSISKEENFSNAKNSSHSLIARLEKKKMLVNHGDQEQIQNRENER